MVEPAIEDIYLCDNCDAEFVGIRKMKVKIHKFDIIYSEFFIETYK